MPDQSRIDLATQIARSDLGIVPDEHGETPASIAYRQGHALHWGHQAWCGMELTHILTRAGVDLPAMQHEGYKGFAACYLGLAYARKHGWIVEEPAPGDIVFFDWQLDGHVDHVGLVVTVSGLAFTSVEGNTGDRPGRVGENHHQVSARTIFARVPEELWMPHIGRGDNEGCPGACWCNGGTCPA